MAAAGKKGMRVMLTSLNAQTFKNTKCGEWYPRNPPIAGYGHVSSFSSRWEVDLNSFSRIIKEARKFARGSAD